MLRRNALGGLCLVCVLSGPRWTAADDQVFLRGDSNADGRVSISDALMTRRYEFNSEMAPPCLEAANTDDIDSLDISDVVKTLLAVFVGTYGIPPPFPEPGADPTPTGMSCDHYQVEPALHTQDVVRFGDVSARPGERVRIPVFLTSFVEVEAFQFVVRYDPTLFTPGGGRSIDFQGTPWEGLGIFFPSRRAYPEAGFFVTAVLGSGTGVIEGYTVNPPPFPKIPPGEDQLICHISGTVSENAVPGTTIFLEPTNGPDGEGVLPPFFLRNELSHRGQARYLSVVPRTLAGKLAIVSDIGFFIRGDSNTDQTVNIADALYTLNYLFLGGPDPSCPDAADADDSGSLDLTDGVVILEQLFLGTGQIQERALSPGGYRPDHRPWLPARGAESLKVSSRSGVVSGR